MAFSIGDTTFVHADATVQFIPNEGPKKSIPFRVRAAQKLEAKHNGKAITMKGTSILPVSIALGEAEPSFSIGLDVAQVAVDLAEHVGNGYARMPYTIVITVDRPSLAPITFRLNQCIIENGFDFTSEAGGQPKSELSGKNRSMVMEYKGKTYDPFAIPGGVDVT
jgi:hypothetical protein